jgi:hypothetical protein
VQDERGVVVILRLGVVGLYAAHKVQLGPADTPTGSHHTV